MKTGDHKKKASRPFWFSWQVVLEPTSPSLINSGQAHRHGVEAPRDFETETQVLLQPLDTWSGFPELIKNTQQK
jgi:hypothetical protein